MLAPLENLMNVKQLEVFRSVMRTGSATRAAEMLGVSQPAVSQLIKTLETHCGFALFTRIHGRMIPTPEAELLLSEVDRVFVGVDRIEQVVAGIRSCSWGSLTIAAFPAMASRFLPRVLTDYCATRSEVRISVESRRSRTLIDWVAADRVDFGIGLLPGDRPGVISEQLLSLSGVCVLPVGHRLAANKVIHARDLASETFISLGSEDRSRFGVDKVFDDVGVQRRIQIETEQSEAACAFVAHGAGVSVVDPFSVYQFDDREITVKPFEPKVVFNLWALFPTARERKATASDFLQFFRTRVDEFICAGPEARSSPAQGASP